MTTNMTKPKGRPTKLTPETRRRILRCIRRGMPLNLAASAAGVALSSLHKWRAQKSFGDAVANAIACGVDSRLKKIEDASDTGDWRASAWLLEHCTPEHFAKSRLELTGMNGSPLAAAVALYLPQKDSTEIKTIPAVTTENETA